MPDFRIAVDLSAIAEQAGSVVNEQVFPLLAQAVRAVAAKTASNWMESVQRARLWSGERDAYAGSIQWKETGPFSALVWSDYKHAAAIEGGRPARDLKRHLDTSPKVRQSAEGRRYLIIPFRHGTPGAEAHARPMPADVYELARALRPSRITGQTRRVSGLIASDVKTRGPMMVNQNLYRWGESLPAGLVAGLYRFNTTTPGGNRYSTYLTFRVMMEGKSGWVIPPQPGLHIAETVARSMFDPARAAFEEAMRRSLAAPVNA
jgi:hypothetical protein